MEKVKQRKRNKEKPGITTANSSAAESLEDVLVTRPVVLVKDVRNCILEDNLLGFAGSFQAKINFKYLIDTKRYNVIHST